MTSTAALSQDQFKVVRSHVAFAILGVDPMYARHPLESDDKERAENIMEAGFIDLQRVLDETTAKGKGNLPLRFSVIEVPVPGQEMSNTYFVEDYHAHGNVTGLGVRLIKSDYARDEDFGQWLQLTMDQLEGWKYVYPLDARS